MGNLHSPNMENYEMWYVKNVRADAMKQMMQDKLCNSSPDVMVAEIRSKMFMRGEKSFTTMIRQF